MTAKKLALLATACDSIGTESISFNLTKGTELYSEVEDMLSQRDFMVSTRQKF
jgi:hypothetical protein